ncbi:MAG: type II toxin-antitoxin system VapC family toxin [Candidatus Asgardarchaeum sp.]
MKLVLDTSAIAAIFFEEEKSGTVEKIVEESEELFTADLTFAELLNIAWKRVVFFNEEKDLVFEALKKAYQFIDSICTIFSTKNLFEKALELAISLKITGYDAVFLALAEKENAKLLTLDDKLANKIKNTRFHDMVIIP